MTLNKIIKRSLAGILILLVLFIATVFVAAAFYKKEIAGLFASYLDQTCGLKVNAESVDVSVFGNWTDATVNFNKISIASSVNPSDELPLFKAGKLSLSLNLKRLLRKEFVVSSVYVKDADIFLVKDSTGTNFTFLKKNSKHKSSLDFDISHLGLENINFRFLNRVRHKTVSFRLIKTFIDPVNYADGLKATLKGDAFVNELRFKEDKGAFLENTPVVLDLKLAYYKTTNAILVYNNSEAVIHNRPYHVGAYVELNKPDRRLVLHVKGKDVDFAEGLKLMDSKIRRSLEQFDVRGPLDVDALIVAELGKGVPPQLMIDIRTRKNNLVIGDSKIPYSDLDIHGKIISLRDSGRAPDPLKALIIFDTIRGKVFSSSFTATVAIKSFIDPHLYAGAQLDVDASKINLKRARKMQLNGWCHASISYSGPVRHIRRSTFLSTTYMKLNAGLRFDRVGFKFSPKSPSYVINGKASLNNDDLMFKNLNLITAGGNFSLDGFVNHFTIYACGYNDGFDATLKARTDLLKLDPLLASRDTTNTDTVGQKKKISQKQIEKITKTPFSFDITLDARKLVFRKLQASDLNAKIKYENATISIPQLKLNTCDGHLDMKVSLHEFSYLKADVKVTDANVKELFKECEDFGQKAISSDNLQGQLSGTIGLTAILDGNFKPEPGSLTGKAEVKLRNGHLLNYEPLVNISHFIFKNRDFEDITFTEIDETFFIQDNKMQINELELASNVLNMYIDGIYDFKGESSINMRIPWSNLKRRGKNYVPQSLGEEGKDAKGLKLNYHGPQNNMKLRLGNH